MMRKLTIFLISLTLCFTTLGCGSSTPKQSENQNFKTTVTETRLADGIYPLQQATYDDGNGEYNLMLLNTPAGTPPVFRTTDLQMARLTDAEIKEGKKSYLKVEKAQKSLYLTEDFKIQYVHNVTETRNNPQTGQRETVIVRQESNFWTPFAGALAGQVVGNMLFRPQYYVPPVYQPSGILTGYGGYGSNYNQAVQKYQIRYNTEPPAVTNRTAFRTTGRLNSPTSTSPAKVNSAMENSRSTGKGFGSSTLKSSGKSNPTLNRPNGFGSSGRSPSRSFGSGRRR